LSWRGLNQVRADAKHPAGLLQVVFVKTSTDLSLNLNSLFGELFRVPSGEGFKALKNIKTQLPLSS
jgi:hypothetical protein